MFCCDGTKERNQRMVGSLGAWDCPLPCLSRKDHIFDIQAASTNNVTDFPARILPTRHSQLWSWLSTSIWATLACLSLKWGPLPTLCLVGILHMACTARPRQSLWRPSWALLPAPGRVWFGAELVFLQDVSISRASTISLKKKTKTRSSHTACIRWTRHVSDSFILSREFVGSWTRTRGFGTWEGFPLSGVAYHQSNPVCRLIRLKL